MNDTPDFKITRIKTKTEVGSTCLICGKSMKDEHTHSFYEFMKTDIHKENLK